LCVVRHGETGGGDGDALFNPPPKDLQAPATQKKTDKELFGYHPEWTSQHSHGGVEICPIGKGNAASVGRYQKAMTRKVGQ